MKELIEKLKDRTYVRAFGLMSPEERECFKKVGKKNCLYYSINSWRCCDTDYFINISTYAISPDYQPEPKLEYVDLEIETVLCLLGTNKNGVFCPLYKLPSLPNFEGFFRINAHGERVWQRFGNVATLISQGKKVYARFRKEN